MTGRAKETEMTEYVVLLMGDAERWWDLTEEERRAGYGAHEKFSAQLVERGHLRRVGLTRDEDHLRCV